MGPRWVVCGAAGRSGPRLAPRKRERRSEGAPAQDIDQQAAGSRPGRGSVNVPPTSPGNIAEIATNIRPSASRSGQKKALCWNVCVSEYVLQRTSQHHVGGKGESLVLDVAFSLHALPNSTRRVRVRSPSLSLCV